MFTITKFLLLTQDFLQDINVGQAIQISKSCFLLNYLIPCTIRSEKYSCYKAQAECFKGNKLKKSTDYNHTVNDILYCCESDKPSVDKLSLSKNSKEPLVVPLTAQNVQLPNDIKEKPINQLKETIQQNLAKPSKISSYCKCFTKLSQHAIRSAGDSKEFTRLSQERWFRENFRNAYNDVKW